MQDTEWQNVAYKQMDTESMHRVDMAGVLKRMTQRGCIVRGTNSVPYPLYLVYVDTNHKLIRQLIYFNVNTAFTENYLIHLCEHFHRYNSYI